LTPDSSSNCAQKIAYCVGADIITRRGPGCAGATSTPAPLTCEMRHE
jgi:hypothetical protein